MKAYPFPHTYRIIKEGASFVHIDDQTSERIVKDIPEGLSEEGQLALKKDFMKETHVLMMKTKYNYFRSY